MIQRTSNTLEQISIELAKLQQVVQALQIQELPDIISDHTLLSNIGTNTHAQIDTALGTIVTDHSGLTGIGTNTHAQIDTHIAATVAHGATGGIVGTTNTQTLLNKTLAKLLFQRSNQTISSGVIIVTSAYHRIDTQAAAATDDLDTLSGMAIGQVVILASTSSSRDITVKHGTGNIFLENNTDFVLGNSRDHIMLICTGGEINELSRSKNS